MRQIGLINRSTEDIRIQNFVSAVKCGGTLEEREISTIG
jgi:hypothetical protein